MDLLKSSLEEICRGGGEEASLEEAKRKMGVDKRKEHLIEDSQPGRTRRSD